MFTYVYIYIYIYIYIYKYMYTHIYTHTYLHLPYPSIILLAMLLTDKLCCMLVMR